MDTLKSFIRYYKPYRAVFFFDLICAMVISLIDLAYPQILRTLTAPGWVNSVSVSVRRICG